MRPLKFLARKVATERNFVPLSTAEVTKGVVDDIRFAFEHGWNETCIVVGGPGEGKSRFIWVLAKMWIAFTQGIFEYCWDIDEIPDVIDGSWVHIDEYLIPEGVGKFQAMQRLKNLYDTGRALMNSISVSSPTTPNIPFSTFEATALAQDFDNRRNLFEIRVPLPRFGMVYIGNMVIPIGQDDEQWMKYEAESRARKKELWDTKGKKTISTKIDTKALAQDVIKFAYEQKIPISSKQVAIALVHKLAEERKWDTNYATEPDIVTWVMIQYSGPNNGKPFIPTASKGWDGLRDALFQWLIHNKETKLQEKTAHYIADWYVSLDLNQTEIGRQYNVGRDAIAKALGTYRDIFHGHESELGKMAEAWLASHVDTLSPRVGTGHRDSADVLLTVDGTEVAINVKWALTEADYRRSFDSTPEHQWEHSSFLAVINSMKNTIRLYPITGQQTYAHHEKGVPCAPEELTETIKKLMAEKKLATPKKIETGSQRQKARLESEDPELAVFMEAVISLAHLSGLEAAEKALKEKGLMASTIRASMDYVRQELERRGLKK